MKEVIDGGITKGTFVRPTFATTLITFGMIPVPFLHAFARMQSPVNSASILLSYLQMEIGVARNQAVTDILSAPLRVRPRFILWMSDDDLPPWDGLVLLWQYMENHPECDLVTSIVHLKNEGHNPTPVLWRWDKDDRRPLLPGKDFNVGDVVEADVGNLGFAIERVELFEKLPAPWFKTGYEVQTLPDGTDGLTLTGEDCYHFEQLRMIGKRVMVHTGVRSSHFDARTGVIY